MSESIIYSNAYFKLIDSGMFFEIYPQLTGRWSIDRDQFIKLYDEHLENLKKNDKIC